MKQTVATKSGTYVQITASAGHEIVNVEQPFSSFGIPLTDLNQTAR
ncbi:MAG TPA: hypothetical protein VFV92_16185 [Candidatus Bathyarchaeia archaeon]|nr:hypothetical protein [Candidatus Bathyarchaeia archaeon]